MLTKIIEAIRSLFSALFGKRDTSPTKPTQVNDPIENIPQDAQEIPQDSIVVISDENDPIEIDDTAVPDMDFDPDLFEEDDEIEEEEEASEPEVSSDIAPTNKDTDTPAEEDTVENEVTPSPEPEPEPEPALPVHEAKFLWCLDNGHGKKSSGKRSPIYDGDKQFFEYEFNRDIVKRIIEKLKEKGVKYFNVVPEVDCGNILKERVNRANSKKSDLPKIYLSIHSNAGPSSSDGWTTSNTKGIETWYYYGSRKGKKLAKTFQKHLIDNTGMKSRGLKTKKEKQFYVLRKTKMPSVLTENGFFNNKAEVKELMKDSIRQQIADAHVAAIMEIEEKGL